jgi:hypothetical protein
VRQHKADDYYDYPAILTNSLIIIRDDVLYVTIYLYMTEPSSQSFSISIYYQEQQYINTIALYTSIGVFVLICLLCSVFFYRCSKSLIGNDRARRIEGVVIHMRDDNVTRLTLQEKNTEVLNRLFEADLGPQDYNDDLNDYKVQVCSICLENLTNDKVSRLSCKHIFHTSCLKDWLFKDILKPKCPNCNFYVIEQENINLNTNNPNPNPDQALINPEVVLVRPPDIFRDNNIN